MKLTEFTALMDTIKIPSTYYAFETPQDPPYFVYYYPNSYNFGADNRVYQQATGVIIELYTSVRDFSIEKQIEDVLDASGIFWDKSNRYDSNEELYETSYEMEILLNE